MLSCKRAKFSLPDHVTYLNGAYMSPLLKDVEKVGVRWLRRKRNPVDIKPSDFFEDSEKLRQAFASLVHAVDASRIAIIPSVSYGMATVCNNLVLSSNDEIVVASEQFPSNYYPWLSLCEKYKATLKVVSAPDTLHDRGKLWNERLLEAIHSNTRVVALAPVHWTDGTRFNLSAIRKRTTEVNAKLIIDGTQAVGALPFDVESIQPDALICAGYKWLLGPYSIGMAYYGPAFDDGKPIEESWMNRLHSENFDQLVNYQNLYQPGALRYDVGEHSNFILVPMLLRSLQQIQKWSVENIQSYSRDITVEAMDKLKGKGVWVEDENYRASHLIGIRLPKSIDLQQIKESLSKQKIYVSFRGDAIRLSAHVYNKKEDLDRFVSAILRHV